WTSGVYQFFKPDVKILTDDTGRKYQQFACNAPNGCKKKTGYKGVREPHSDRSSTSNLKKHADSCWGKDVVKARLQGTGDAAPRDGNIFSAFARVGQRPVKVTHRAHTEPEARAHFVRWIAEANRAVKIVEDRELKELLEAGRPDFKTPSRRTVARDLNTAYERCSGRIQELLENYPGCLSFATDAWTSPNHRAFVAWTVHLQYEGQPLVFLLDIYEVPEVCISPAMLSGLTVLS
ncbi:hypothetical protein C8R45DRAFT_813319, partial [Mycena sanguinolenta]